MGKARAQDWHRRAGRHRRGPAVVGSRARRVFVTRACLQSVAARPWSMIRTRITLLLFAIHSKTRRCRWRLGCLLLRTVRDCRILAALRPRQQRERNAAYRWRRGAAMPPRRLRLTPMEED